MEGSAHHGAFYLVYSWSRNQFGSAQIAADGVPEQAFHNAERVIAFETGDRAVHEQTVQEWFLDHRWFIQFWNTYYGTAHFIVTFAVFWVLFKKRPDVFPLWRNTLAAMNGPRHLRLLAVPADAAAASGRTLPGRR